MPIKRKTLVFGLLLVLATMPGAWIFSTGLLYYSIDNPSEDVIILIERGCAEDGSQKVWVEQLDFAGKVSCAEAIARSRTGGVRAASLIVRRTRVPSFFLLETVVQCTYKSVTNREGASVKCRTFTDAL
jgi:hypothetical protein